MRQLTPRPRQRGLTLIELMITITIGAILVVQGLPAYADYTANARLREGANVLQSGAVFARSEAIKRNQQVRVDVTSQRLVVTLIDNATTPATTTTLRGFELPAGVQAASFTATFDSAGRPVPFGTDVSTNLSLASRTCGGDLRCPGVHIEPGGAISLCRTGCP